MTGVGGGSLATSGKEAGKWATPNELLVVPGFKITGDCLLICSVSPVISMNAAGLQQLG
ncbi:hypothetical protein [Microcoleus sp. FACHB-68]|uniref:hypothetical protein n=1 Tax=Microcoleus sp. FACHB-68 TaxID=2692826 RepID=UPI0016883D81|nr:hypothetical protein [Microcoleus sp. FACHB-68]MBD1936386.1 hypothetical protein [Microcoleus sp. FACHB-68]